MGVNIAVKIATANRCYRLPRAPQLARTVSTARCDGCTAEHFLNDGCVAERHHCMEGVDAAQVIHWLEKVMS